MIEENAHVLRGRGAEKSSDADKGGATSSFIYRCDPLQRRVGVCVLRLALLLLRPIFFGWGMLW
jgi:hypothetical protein